MGWPRRSFSPCADRVSARERRNSSISRPNSGRASAPIFDYRTNRLDLWRLTRDQLKAVGLREDRIFSLDLCTHDLPQFFSYRRDRTTGRQVSLIWIKEG